MLGKFNLYDFIAVVIPGLLFLWVMSIFVNQFGTAIHIPFAGGIAETSVLVALSYVTGLLLQGISQGITEKVLLWLWCGFPSAKWLLPEDTHLSIEYKNRIRFIVKQKFGISANDTEQEVIRSNERLQKNQEIFYLCYNAVEKLSDRPYVFNAQYGLFRSLLTVFLLIVVISLSILIFSTIQRNSLFLTILLISTAGIILSYLRVKKRAEDFAKSIYDLFLVHYGKE